MRRAALFIPLILAACSAERADKPGSATVDGGDGADGAADGGDGADGSDGAGDGGDTDDTGGILAAHARIGPEGGAVALPDGTTLLIPPGAFDAEVELRLREVDPVATRYTDPVDDWGGAYTAVGPAFVVEPPLTPIRDVQLSVPLSLMAGSADPESVMLVASGWGPAETGRGEGLPDPTAPDELAHPAVARLEDTATHAIFNLPTLGGLTFQALAYPTAEASRSATPPPTGVRVRCSDELAVVFGAVPPGIGLSRWSEVDARVAINDTTAAQRGRNRAAAAAAGLSTEELEQLDDSYHQVLARTCLAAWRTIEMARAGGSLPGALGLPWPSVDLADPSSGPKKLSVTLAWSAECPARVVWGRLAAGADLQVYLDPTCVSDAAGFTTYRLPNWNTGEAPNTSQADFIEATVAHELYHYAHSWADGETAKEIKITEPSMGLTSAAFYSEAAADAFAELIYDNVGAFSFQPPAIWQRHAPACTEASNGLLSLSYTANGLWRSIDYTREDPTTSPSVLALALLDLRDRAAAAGCPGVACAGVTQQLADLDRVIGQTRPSAPSFTLREAFTDFAADYLYAHAVEGGLSGDPTDHAPDVNGGIYAETGPGDLWGRPPGGCADSDPFVAFSPGQATMDAHYSPSLSSRDGETSFDAAPWQATLVEPTFREGVLTPDAHIRFTLSSEPPLAGAARIFGTTRGEKVLLGELNAVDDSVTLTPAELTAGFTLVITNTARPVAEAIVTLHTEEVVPRGLVLGSGGLAAIDPTASASTPACDTGAEPPLEVYFRGGVAPAFVPSEGFLVSYPFQSEVRRYDSATCADLGPIGGTIPNAHALALTPDGEHLVVGQGALYNHCAPNSISIHDPRTGELLNEVSVPVAIHDIALLEVGGKPWAAAAPAGDVGCEGSSLYLVNVEALVAATTPELAADAMITVPVGGDLTGHIDGTPRGPYAAWTKRGGSSGWPAGEVAVYDASRGVIFHDTIDADGDGMAPLGDLAIEQVGADAQRIYFLVEQNHDPDSYDAAACLGSGVTCGAIRWYDRAGGAASVAGLWQLNQPLPARLGASPGGQVWVGHSGDDSLSVLDFDNHTGGRSGESRVPVVTSPTQIWLP